MKLHEQFSKNYLMIFLITFSVGGFITYFIFYDININLYKENLKKNTSIIKLQLPMIKDYNTFAQNIAQISGDRFTLIDAEGQVVAEGYEHLKELGNHLYREEIVQARRSGEGFFVRHSKSVDKDLLYYASTITLDNGEYYVRLATPLVSIKENFFNILVSIVVLLLLSMFIGFVITYRLGEKTREEILKVTNTLDEIANKNYKAIVNASFADEFRQIETHIKKLSLKLEKRSKQKRKYTAKIRLISKQRSDIISAISHEFKNPIASIIGYGETLIEDPNTNTQIRERFLDKIVKNANKISNMIDRLSLATKFENGDLTPQKSEFDLGKLCDDILQGFIDKYPQRKFEFLPQAMMAKADKTMIEMVIVNLLDNAIKYSQGKIILEFKDEALHIRDFGIGIKLEEQEKVTNKFYRSNTFSWDNSIGLGLALVKHILSLHDSELHIQSELGVGSDFSFVIKS